jgi:hypothetical protein
MFYLYKLLVRKIYGENKGVIYPITGHKGPEDE